MLSPNLSEIDEKNKGFYLALAQIILEEQKMAETSIPELITDLEAKVIEINQIAKALRKNKVVHCLNTWILEIEDEIDFLKEKYGGGL